MSESRALRKSRGAFFTPPALAEFLVEWAVRGAEETVLEPSCGDAAFLRPAANRLLQLGMPTSRASKQLHGVEVHGPSAREATRTLSQEFGIDITSSLHVRDFFELRAGPNGIPTVDAVVGNPPFVRYQSFTGPQRARGREAALAAGVSLPGLASSWAAFVVHASTFLNPSGRLGLVLPAELLSVNYAAPVRRFLLERFGWIRLILFDERVFPGVLEEVVLVLAEGEGPCEHFDVAQARDTDALPDIWKRNWTEPPTATKWSGLVLPPEAEDVLQLLASEGVFTTLSEWGTVTLGAVTGGNDFFCLSQEVATERSLSTSDMLRISPPGSRHLRGTRFTDRDWETHRQRGSKVFLFYPSGSALDGPSLRYIAEGERQNQHLTYKCRSRKPWWRVPVVPVPDLFLTYMNHDGPRLVANEARVAHVNSVHGVQLKPEDRDVGSRMLPLAVLSSASLLGAELVGRAYGGGLLKLEPREAMRLPVPNPEVVMAAAQYLKAAEPEVVAALGRRDLRTATALVDQALLGKTIGLSPTAIAELNKGRELMFGRRDMRSRS